ncbi:MAG: hypothetical protein WA020_15075 [Candidatus Acidiferrales bacterium]
MVSFDEAKDILWQQLKSRPILPRRNIRGHLILALILAIVVLVKLILAQHTGAPVR